MVNSRAMDRAELERKYQEIFDVGDVVVSGRLLLKEYVAMALAARWERGAHREGLESPQSPKWRPQRYPAETGVPLRRLPLDQ